jgi:NAD(P)-dependent dehydrogenase (short-subunit alcohol dehydrogenase family)
MEQHTTHQAERDTSGGRRTAVITGGSQGLGLALAETLVADGCSVATDARRTDRLEQAAGRLRAAAGPDVTIDAIAGDVTDAAHRRRLADAARRRGNVRLVVNNASTLGGSPLPALTDIDADMLRQIFDVNVVAPLALIGDVAADLGPGAVIVNISSDAGVEAYESWGGYGASKAALDHASRVLAAEHPDWRVYAVDPGDMRTEMHQDAFPGDDISDRPPPEAAVPGLLALIDGGHPSGRYQAHQAAHAVTP